MSYLVVKVHDGTVSSYVQCETLDKAVVTANDALRSWCNACRQPGAYPDKVQIATAQTQQAHANLNGEDWTATVLPIGNPMIAHPDLLEATPCLVNMDLTSGPQDAEVHVPLNYVMMYPHDALSTRLDYFNNQLTEAIRTLAQSPMGAKLLAHGQGNLTYGQFLNYFDRPLRMAVGIYTVNSFRTDSVLLKQAENQTIDLSIHDEDVIFLPTFTGKARVTLRHADLPMEGVDIWFDIQADPATGAVSILTANWKTRWQNLIRNLCQNSGVSTTYRLDIQLQFPMGTDLVPCIASQSDRDRTPGCWFYLDDASQL